MKFRMNRSNKESDNKRDNIKYYDNKKSLIIKRISWIDDLIR